MHGSRAQLTIPLRSCYGQLKAMSTAAATKPAVGLLYAEGQNLFLSPHPV